MEIPKWVWIIVMLFGWIFVAWFTFFGYCFADGTCYSFKYQGLAFVLVTIGVAVALVSYIKQTFFPNKEKKV